MSITLYYRFSLISQMKNKDQIWGKIINRTFEILFDK